MRTAARLSLTLLPVVTAAAVVLLPVPASHNAAQRAAPGGGDWPMAAKDYANTRYSELDQITAANIKDLKLGSVDESGSL